MESPIDQQQLSETQRAELYEEGLLRIIDDSTHQEIKLYASSKKSRSEPRHSAAWHEASEMSFRVNSANSEWKHIDRKARARLYTFMHFHDHLGDL